MFKVLPVGRRFKFNVHCSAIRQGFKVQRSMFCQKAEIQGSMSIVLPEGRNSSSVIQCSARRQRIQSSVIQ